MQGALFGARSLGTGFGPILFATIFSLFSRTDSPFPFFPGDAAFSTTIVRRRDFLLWVPLQTWILIGTCPWDILPFTRDNVRQSFQKPEARSIETNMQAVAG